MLQHRVVFVLTNQGAGSAKTGTGVIGLNVYWLVCCSQKQTQPPSMHMHLSLISLVSVRELHGHFYRIALLATIAIILWPSRTTALSQAQQTHMGRLDVITACLSTF